MLTSARYVLTRPRLKPPAHVVVRQVPLIERHLRQLVNPRFPAAGLGRRGREINELLLAAIARRAETSR